ncbi:hypothetical protein JOC61_001234 [Marinitoga litoralis]|nr:hypothetical protein [Marinitoga litoralis]
MSIAYGHLGWNLHPFGGFTAFGTSPLGIIFFFCNLGSGSGTAEINTFVYRIL